MLKDSNVILAWALTTFIGWTITAAGYTLLLKPSTVMLIWTGLMSIPVFFTVLKFYENDSNVLFNAWTLLTAVLILQNFLFSSFPVFSYFTLWMIGVAAAYYYTYSKIPPLSEKTYLYGAIANLIATPLIYFVPLQFFSVIAGIVQAGPVFYDWYNVHR